MGAPRALAPLGSPNRGGCLRLRLPLRAAAGCVLLLLRGRLLLELRLHDEPWHVSRSGFRGTPKRCGVERGSTISSLRANRPRMRGRESASVLRQAYLIFLEKLRTSLFSRYLRIREALSSAEYLPTRRSSPDVSSGLMICRTAPPACVRATETRSRRISITCVPGRRHMQGLFLTKPAPGRPVQSVQAQGRWQGSSGQASACEAVSARRLGSLLQPLEVGSVAAGAWVGRPVAGHSLPASPPP
eukprot:scaffold218_cov333-Prasinococcus_capsulatus_cf.AAC.4